jgi:hypothetical protein
MRNREVIEREMYRAREDLESSIAELKHVVQEKVDVKARAKVAVEKGKLMAADVLERGKQSAIELAERGKQGAIDLAQRGKEGAVDLAQRGKEGAAHLYHKGEDRAYFTYLKAKDRPVLTASIIGGIVAAGVLIYVGRRNDWW